MDRHQHVEALKRKLDELDHEVDTLEGRLRDAGGELQVRGRRALDDLRVTRLQLQDRLAELASTGDDAWQRLRLHLDSAWDTLKTGLRAAKDELVPPSTSDGQQGFCGDATRSRHEVLRKRP
jgi:predicted nuclease with TOPRIM domain